MNIVLFPGDHIGMQISQWLLDNYAEDIKLVVVESKDNPSFEIFHGHYDTLIFESDKQVANHLATLQIDIDYCFLSWSNLIIREPLLSLPKHGFISMHPALLPYNRGANFNIYPIVEESPYGVSLFYINDINLGIDTGDIAIQKQINYGWEDTGETLRKKGEIAIVELFKEAYSLFRLGKIKRKKQDLSIGTTHYKKELNEASNIDLDKMYTARHLLNWLRARTFQGYPACHFYIHKKYTQDIFLLRECA